MYERNSVDMCINLADHTVIINNLARSKETNRNCILYHLRHPGDRQGCGLLILKGHNDLQRNRLASPV